MSLLDELEQRYLSTAKPDTQRRWKETVNRLWDHVRQPLTEALQKDGVTGVIAAAPGLVTKNLADFQSLGKIGHEVFESWDPRLQRRVQEEVIYHTSGHRPKGGFTPLPAWGSAESKNGLSELPDNALLVPAIKSLVGEPFGSLLEQALGGKRTSIASSGPSPAAHHAATGGEAGEAPAAETKTNLLDLLWKLVNETPLKGILLGAVGLKAGELEPNIAIPGETPAHGAAQDAAKAATPKLETAKIEAVTKAPSASDLPKMPPVAKPAHAKHPRHG